MAGSYDLLNYATRPNKSVERKMIVEALQGLAGAFPVADYRYIGFGSMWFSDFILVHRVLRISDMVSIEQDDSRTDRANFNRPFKCVRVVMGSSSRVLPTLGWADGRTICWLDYDGGLEASMLGDIDLVCRFAHSGSVVLATVNAHQGTLERSGEQTSPGERSKARAEVLAEIAGGAFPSTITQITAANAPTVIAETLLNQMIHSTRQSGRPMTFVPLMNFVYSDGAPMATAGGIILDDADATAFRALKLASRFRYLTGTQQFKIDVPHLTAREKLVLDQLLPHTKSPTVRELGFTLPKSKIDAYRDLYRFYPFFGELLF